MKQRPFLFSDSAQWLDIGRIPGVPLLFLGWVLLAFISAPSSAYGQVSANKADVLGTVYDPSGAIVPDASITVLNSSTGLIRETKTSERGQYQFLRLDPGIYTLTATAQSFAVHRVEGVHLSVGASVKADMTLQVEETSTTIDVSATLIEVENTAPSTGIPELAIENLPINGRRFQDFATLTPTVQVEPERSTLSFVGQRGVNSNVMLDATDYNNPFFGGMRGGERANLVPTVPQSAVEQFEVVTTGYSAEYGRSSGGTLNVITKSGNNNFHGGAFWQYRDGELGTENPIAEIKSGATQHQFGGSIGGPILRDKLFFFGAVERQQHEAPRVVDFFRLDNVAPTAEQQEAFDFYRSQEGPFTLTNDATVLTTRADYQTLMGNRLTLRYNFSDAQGENATNTGDALDPSTNRAVANDGIEKDRTHTGTAQYTHLFSADLLNDLRFNYTYEERPRLANSTQPNVGTTIGNTGNRNFLPTTEDDKRIQISDSLSWTMGAHSLRLGVDYNYVTASQAFGFNQFGTFSFSSSGSAATLETLEIMGVGGTTPDRFDSGRVSSYALQIGNLLADMNMHQSAFFVQDNWRATPELSLNLGLRWEGQFNFDPEATNTELVNLVRGKVSPLGAELDPTQIPDATDQWMPRFGFAWSPSNMGRRFVVRGHTGLFYASTPLLLLADASNNFRATPGNVSITLRPTPTMTIYDQFLSVGVDLNQFSLDNLPVLTPEQVTQAAANATGVEPNPFTGATLGFIAKDYENPRSFQIGLGTDVEVTGNTTAGVEFNYVNTVHLQRNMDHNLANAAGNFCANPTSCSNTDDAARRPYYGNLPRPIPSLSNFHVRESSARSMYRGVTFKLEHRARMLTAGAFYTVSETFSDDDNERSATGYQADDMFNLDADYSYSRIDFRHQFNSYAVLALPLGFEVSGSLLARSGRPVNPTASGNPNGDGSSFSDRPYSAPGVVFERMSFRNRSVVNTNMRVLKNFGFTEGLRLQFSAEFFNLFDLDNVVFGSNFGDDSYGPGINPVTGEVVPADAGFLRLRLADGSYDAANRQEGGPFQAQFGIRFFF
jgi:hypothetical protein